MRRQKDWQTEARDPREFMEQLRTDLILTSVYVFTPKGRVVELGIARMRSCSPAGPSCGSLVPEENRKRR